MVGRIPRGERALQQMPQLLFRSAPDCAPIRSVERGCHLFMDVYVESAPDSGRETIPLIPVRSSLWVPSGHALENPGSAGAPFTREGRRGVFHRFSARHGLPIGPGGMTVLNGVYALAASLSFENAFSARLRFKGGRKTPGPISQGKDLAIREWQGYRAEAAKISRKSQYSS